MMFMGAGSHPGLTILLIAAPSDGAVFDYFRALAARWEREITAEYLTIDGDIPLSAGLCSEEVSPPIRKIIAADVQILMSVELHFHGLKICYLRSGGSGPTVFRDSFFDELQVTLDERGNELIAQAAIKAACDAFEVETIRSGLTPDEQATSDPQPSNFRSNS
jgi:hypothetical protein